MVDFNRLTAREKGNPANSKGSDVVGELNNVFTEIEAMRKLLDLNDGVYQTGYRTSGGDYHFIAGAKKLVFLESVADNLVDALKAYTDDKVSIKAMAARNQAKIEKAIGTRDAQGNLVGDDNLPQTFNVELPVGYFPIEGDIDLPPCTGAFLGQGAIRRKKALSFNGSPVFNSILEHPTCLLPVGGSDKSGIRTQCGSTRIGGFAIHGGMKDDGDGGHGIIEGFTPPIPAYAAASTEKGKAPSKSNPFTQNNFGKPFVYSGIKAFQKVNNTTEITVPAKGTYTDATPIVNDDTVDIPLVRWVRAFDSSGAEIARYANIGQKLGGGIVGINDKDRQCTSKPKQAGETRAYHKPIKDADTTTVVVVPDGGLPDQTDTVEVSFYNLERHKSYAMLMMPFLSGSYSVAARAQGNFFENIVIDSMPWNGMMMVDGAYNQHTCIIARNNGLDGFHAPAGYEDFMHNTFDSCGAVNNKGWGIKLREPFMGSSSALDSNKWPTDAGAFEVHRKMTYTASLNNLSNFDTYGNRGGAMYMGGDSNSLTCGGMEHHFDSNNIDPFGTSAKKDLGDWNPLRWAGCVVFAALCRQNKITVTGTPTDSRRVLMADWKNTYQSPAPTNPDSNRYTACAGNHYTHPRSDVYGSLVDLRPTSFSTLFFTQYAENERAGGNIFNKGGTGIMELMTTWAKKDTLLFQPFLYNISPKKNFENESMQVVFSVQEASNDVANKGFIGVSADRMGLVNQFDKTLLFVNDAFWVQSGAKKDIPAGGRIAITSTLSSSIMRINEDIENLDMTYLTTHVNYIDDFKARKAQGGRISNTPIPDHIVVESPKLRRYQNNAGTWLMQISFNLHNTSTADYTGVQGERHAFNFKVENHAPNRAITVG